MHLGCSFSCYSVTWCVRSPLSVWRFWLDHKVDVDPPPSPEQKSKSYSSTRLFVCRCCLTCPSFYVSSWWFLTESVNIKEKYTILYSKRVFVAFVMVASGRSGNGERVQMSRHLIHVYHTCPGDSRTTEIVRQYCCGKTTWGKKKRLRESPFQPSNAPHGVWLQVLLSHGYKRQKQMHRSSFTDLLDLIFGIGNGCFELTCKVELVLKALGSEKHPLHVLPVLELDVGTGHTALVILLRAEWECRHSNCANAKRCLGVSFE